MNRSEETDAASGSPAGGLRAADRFAELDWKAHGAAITDLRRRWLVPTDAPPLLASAEVSQPLDARATHWGYVVDGEIVAAVRASIHDSAAGSPDFADFASLDLAWPPPVASFNKLVVHPDFRGQGLAAEADRVVIAWARAMGARSAMACIVPNASRLRQVTRAGFRILANPIHTPPYGPMALLRHDLLPRRV